MLSSEALFTAKNVMTISFGNSFTEAPDSPLPDRMFILGKFDVKNVFSSRVRLETTLKVDFHCRVIFTCARR